MNYVHSNMAQNPNLESNNGNSANLAFYTQYIAPIYPLYVRMVDANGNPYIVQNSYGGNKYDYGVPSTGYQGNGTRLFLSTGNPIGSNRYNEDRTTRNQINSQFNFDVQFTPWLRLTSVNTLSYDMRESSAYSNPYEVLPPVRTADSSRTTSLTSRRTTRRPSTSTRPSDCTTCR